MDEIVSGVFQSSPIKISRTEKSVLDIGEVRVGDLNVAWFCITVGRMSVCLIALKMETVICSETPVPV